MRMIHIRFDPQGIEAAHIPHGMNFARNYITKENDIIRRIQPLMCDRQIKIEVGTHYGPAPWGVSESAPKRIIDGFRRGVLEYPVEKKPAIRAIRDLLRGWYSAFISIDNRIGVTIAGRGTIYFSNLSPDEVETLNSNGMGLTECPRVVPDESLWV